jgi:hypothetical protein
MPRLRLSPAPSGTKPVPMSFVLEQLREARALAAAAAAAAGGELPPTAAAFGYNALEITAAQQLQAPDSGRATRHVEVQLPEGMEYEPGAAPACVHACMLGKWTNRYKLRTHQLAHTGHMYNH